MMTVLRSGGESMTQKLILVRGLPGSGKSTLAAMLPGTHVEADDFFIVNGEYKFDGSRIGEAHGWCLSKCREALERGEDVVVSNTFTRLWEMRPYIDAATEFGIVPFIVMCENSFGSIHVGDDVIERMRARWETFK